MGKGGSASVGAVAMWKLRGLDKWLFEGAEAKIFEFLDIEPLMPPGRLRLSKALGRPCMGDIDCHCMAIVSLDEARRMDCEVAGQHGFSVIRYGGSICSKDGGAPRGMLQSILRASRQWVPRIVNLGKRGTPPIMRDGLVTKGRTRTHFSSIRSCGPLSKGTRPSA